MDDLLKHYPQLAAAVKSAAAKAPNLTLRLAPSSRVIRTSGLPLRLTTTSSPSAALSTSRDSLVLAS